MNDILEKIENSNIVGEALREYSFLKTKDGYGGYSYFDLEPDFKKVIDGQTYSDACSKVCGTDSFDDDFDHNERSRVSCYYSEKSNILVAWYWDGDGTLYFKWNSKELLNRDCKKNNRWEWL